MMEWLYANLGTILIAAVLSVIVILIIRGIIKDKKSRRSGCGAGCPGCAMKGSCHHTR